MASVYKTLSGTDNHEKETGERKNKQRVLILVCILDCRQLPRANKLQSSRGVTFRHRHLLQDLYSLM